MPHKDPAERKLYARDLARRLRKRRAIARMAARNARVKNRPKIRRADCIWAAGHFEGEGTVTLTKGGRIMNVRPCVTLSSTDRECTAFFQDRWPGHWRSFIPRSVTGNVRRAYTWTLSSGERIEIFLADILPHVRTQRVREKIEIVLADIRDRGLYQQQPESKVRSEERRKLIRSLNAKGPRPGDT